MNSSTDALAKELDVTLQSPWATANATPQRWLKATLVMQLLVLGVVVATGYWLGQRLDAHRAALTAHEVNTAALGTKLDGLAGDLRGVSAEVSNLRQTVASHTAEDVLFLKILFLKSNIDVELARTIAVETHRQAQTVQRDPDLVLAIMAVESDFQPKATSVVGAVGLMQVMPHWKRVLGITSDLYDIPTNLRYGLQVLSVYEEMYQDLEMALTAYNRGPGPVDLALRKGQDARNGYAAKVLATYSRLKQLSARGGEH